MDAACAGGGGAECFFTNRGNAVFFVLSLSSGGGEKKGGGFFKIWFYKRGEEGKTGCQNGVKKQQQWKSESLGETCTDVFLDSPKDDTGMLS